MDPLSLGASVIAIVGVTGKVIKGIRSLKALRDAPRELDDLLDEVSQFETIIRAVQNASQDTGSDLKGLIETAQRILTELESLIEHKLTEVGTSKKVDRWQWIRSPKDVKRLRGRLQDVTGNLVALLGVNSSNTIYQVSQVANQTLTEQRQFSSQFLQAMTVLTQLLEESPPTRAALTRSLGNIRQLSVEPTVPENSAVAESTESGIHQANQYATESYSQRSISISKIQKFSICNAYCNCQCHVQRSISVPSILSKIFGRGYVQKAGSMIFGNQCDTEMCRAQAAPRVSIQYYLPQWLACRMVLMWMTCSPLYGVELLIKTPRVLERHSAAFAAVWADDSRKLEVALRRGECTSYDVDHHGLNLFEYALVSTRWKALHYLSNDDDGWILSAAKICVEDMLQILLCFINYEEDTPHLNQRRSIAFKLQSLIESESYVEMQTTTTLHRIVSGTSDLSLEAELRGLTTIDKLDARGRSALWYAVKYRKLHYVQSLLEHGADPNIGDQPMWVHIDNDEDRAIDSILIHHGLNSSLDMKLQLGYGWLPRFCWTDKGKKHVAIDELLFRHGFNLNDGTSWKGVKDVTFLMRVSSRIHRHSHGTPQRVEQLIRFGAEVESTDGEGKTAIMYAVIAACGLTFAVLARAGARLDRKTLAGHTILHLAILHKPTQLEYVKRLCKALSDVDLTALDLDARDEDGNTAYDLLRLRNGPDWEGYYCSRYIDLCLWVPGNEIWLMHEVKGIGALEKLLHHVQTSQGVPEADQYPPLGEYGCRDVQDKPVPGEWPVTCE